MTDYNDHHDYGTRGTIEQRIEIKQEQLEAARLDGDVLTAHNRRHEIYELEKQLETETREPNRVTA